MALTRTFLAIELDEPTRAFIAAQVAALGPQMPGVRFVGSETWHLTLAFLGELTDDQVAAAQTAARAAAAASAPFTLHVAGLGSFGPEAAPRVIWLGVGGAVAELYTMQQQVTAALLREGLTHDGRFSPHITLARLRHPLAPAEAAAFNVARAQTTDGPAFTVSQISVMRSDLAPDGARYTAMLRVPLTATR